MLQNMTEFGKQIIYKIGDVDKIICIFFKTYTAECFSGLCIFI